jgi:hypothetical protein
MKIEIPLFLDDMPLSPEAFRVYFAIARSMAEFEEFPSIEGITARCFGKKYALGRTHTILALTELIKWNLVREGDTLQVTNPQEWKTPGGAA